MEKEIIASNLTLAYMVKQLVNAVEKVPLDSDGSAKNSVQKKYSEFLEWIKDQENHRPGK